MWQSQPPTALWFSIPSTIPAALDRVLAAVPSRVYDVEVAHYDGKKVLIAAQDTLVPTIYHVDVDVYSRKMGKVTYSRTVRFVSDLEQVESWISEATQRIHASKV